MINNTSMIRQDKKQIAIVPFTILNGHIFPSMDQSVRTTITRTKKQVEGSGPVRPAARVLNSLRTH